MADNVHVYSVITRGLTEVQLASGFDFTHTGFLILFLHCHMNFLISSIHLFFFFLADYQYFVLHSMFFSSFYVFAIDGNGRFREDGLQSRVRLHVDTVL